MAYTHPVALRKALRRESCPIIHSPLGSRPQVPCVLARLSRQEGARTWVKKPPLTASAGSLLAPIPLPSVGVTSSPLPSERLEAPPSSPTRLPPSGNLRSWPARERCCGFPDSCSGCRTTSPLQGQRSRKLNAAYLLICPWRYTSYQPKPPVSVSHAQCSQGHAGNYPTSLHHLDGTA